MGYPIGRNPCARRGGRERSASSHPPGRGRVRQGVEAKCLLELECLRSRKHTNTATQQQSNTATQQHSTTTCKTQTHRFTRDTPHTTSERTHAPTHPCTHALTQRPDAARPHNPTAQQTHVYALPSPPPPRSRHPHGYLHLPLRVHRMPTLHRRDVFEIYGCVLSRGHVLPWSNFVPVTKTLEQRAWGGCNDGHTPSLRWRAKAKLLAALR